MTLAKFLMHFIHVNIFRNHLSNKCIWFLRYNFINIDYRLNILSINTINMIMDHENSIFLLNHSYSYE